MATSDQVDTAAGVNALGPKKVQQGTNILEQHSIDEQIKLSKYLQEQTDAVAAAAKPQFGLRMSRLNSINGCG